MKRHMPGLKELQARHGNVKLDTHGHIIQASLSYEMHLFNSRRFNFLGGYLPVYMPQIFLQPKFKLILNFKELVKIQTWEKMSKQSWALK